MMDFGFDIAGTRQPRLWRGSALSVASALLEAASILVAALVLSRVFRGEAASISAVGIAGGLSALLVASYLLKVLGSTETFTATYHIACVVRLRLADHLRRLPMGFWNQQRRGTIGSVLTDDFNLYTEIMTHSWSLMVVNVALPAALGVGLLWLDVPVGLAALAPVPLALLAIPWSFRLLNAAADSLMVERNAAIDHIVEYTEGIETFRAFGRTGAAHEALTERLRRLEAQSMKTEVAAAPALLTYSLVVYAGFVLAAVVGAARVAAGAMTGGQWVLSLLVTLLFVRALASLVMYLAESRFAARTLKKMRELLAEPVQSSRDHAPPLEPRPRLQVEDVRFAYEDRPALDGVSVSFAPGTVTALVGPSGSGKSTLAHLLLRLWDVDEGRITIDGHDVRDISLSALHREMAMVFQDVVLFSDTVLDNIRLGVPDATPEQVIAAAEAAQAHDFIEALPEGYHTRLGPGAHDLSGGQRQRIAIARALLKDAPILVLDEATASLDPDSEHLIQQAIAALMEGRTVIVIAHRLWTVQHADQIVVLEEGRIVQRGRHRDLLGEDGLYQQMWRAQQESRAWSLGAPTP